jgi:hypothetical protein
VGIDFVTGNYAPGSLFLTAMELVFIFLLIGHIVASMFFPPLQKRLRRRVAQQGKALVRASLDRCRADLRDHVDAVDQLSHEGRGLLRTIDRTVTSLANEKPQAGVDRLFGQPEPVLEAVPVGAQPTRRRPQFD